MDKTIANATFINFISQNKTKFELYHKDMIVGPVQSFLYDVTSESFRTN